MATSAKCCELAPVSLEYTPKGRYEKIAGVNTYIVGSEDATKGIIDVYDIFGIWPQTIQGADRLSVHAKALVLVPDFFDGSGLDKKLLPLNTDEKKQKFQEFIATTAKPESNIEKLLAVRKEVAVKYPAIEGHWGVFGLCWGGKLAVLVSGEGNEGVGRRFNVSGTAHPGQLEAKDAEAQTAPHILLASPDEPAEAVAQYKEILAKPGKEGYVETFSTMFHGWMGARADLSNEDNVKEFHRGYEKIGEYFSKYL